MAFEAANRASAWNLAWSQYYPYDAFQFNAVHKNEIDISQFDPDDLNGAQYGHENEIAYNLTDDPYVSGIREVFARCRTRFARYSQAKVSE